MLHISRDFCRLTAFEPGIIKTAWLVKMPSARWLGFSDAEADLPSRMLRRDRAAPTESWVAGLGSFHDVHVTGLTGLIQRPSDVRADISDPHPRIASGGSLIPYELH